MSTILKALRRLEEDNPASRSRLDGDESGDAIPATDPRAADALRDRILAEEYAAAAVPDEYPDPTRRKRITVLMAALSFVLIGAIGVYALMSVEAVDAPQPEQIAAAPTPRESIPTKPTPVRTPDRPQSPAAPTLATRATAPAESPFINRAKGAGDADGADAPNPVNEVDEVDDGSTPALAPLAPIPVALSGNGNSVVETQLTPTAASAAQAPTHPAPASIPAAEAARVAPTRALAGSKRIDEIPIAAVTPTPAVQAENVRRGLASPNATPPASSRRATPSATTTSKPAQSSKTGKPQKQQEPPNPRRAQESPASTTAERVRAGSATETSLAASAASKTRPKPEPSRAQAPAPSVSAPLPKTLEDERPGASRPASQPAQTEVVEHPGLPDLSVVRTAWHPTPTRRSAKIRLEDTHEVLTLREGDAVGGLVVKEISPSAVLFKAGEVEIRRRVGQGRSID